MTKIHVFLSYECSLTTWKFTFNRTVTQTCQSYARVVQNQLHECVRMAQSSNPPKTQASIQLRICSKACKLLFTNDLHPVFQSLSVGEILGSKCAKLIETYPRRLAAEISTKEGSTKYWPRWVYNNRAANVCFLKIFFYLINLCITIKSIWHKLHESNFNSRF